MGRAFASPVRNLAGGMLFVLTVMALAIGAYVLAGWSFGDALYMTVLTVFTVGYGRIGNMLARELHAARAAFVIVERSESRDAEAHASGYLCLCADATEEEALLRAGISRARALATVLPDDAANVFITLSARNLK